MIFDENLPPENSDENRGTSAKIDFPKIGRDHSGSVPGLQKRRKTLEKLDFGTKKNCFFDPGSVPDDQASLN